MSSEASSDFQLLKQQLESDLKQQLESEFVLISRDFSKKGEEYNQLKTMLEGDIQKIILRSLLTWGNVRKSTMAIIAVVTSLIVFAAGAAAGIALTAKEALKKAMTDNQVLMARNELLRYRNEGRGFRDGIESDLTAARSAIDAERDGWRVLASELGIHRENGATVIPGRLIVREIAGQNENGIVFQDANKRRRWDVLLERVGNPNSVMMRLCAPDQHERLMATVEDTGLVVNSVHRSFANGADPDSRFEWKTHAEESGPNTKYPTKYHKK